MKTNPTTLSAMPTIRRPLGIAAAMLGLLAVPVNASSLSLFLDFENNVNDQSGNALTTTLTGTMAYDADVPAAIGSGTSGAFDGDTRWVDVAPNALINGNAFTLMYFLKVEAVGGLIGTHDRITSRGGFEFDTAVDENTGQLRYHSSGWKSLGATIPVDGSAWRHIAWQDDGSSMTLYVDGVSVVSGQPSTGTLSQFMRIGAVQSVVVGVGTNEGLNGLMDDFAWFDDTTDPLSVTDIQFIANNGVQAFVVPEPSSAMLLAGFGVFAMARRRRR